MQRTNSTGSEIVHSVGLAPVELEERNILPLFSPWPVGLGLSVSESPPG